MVLRLAEGRGHARRSPAGPVRPSRVDQFRARAANCFEGVSINVRALAGTDAIENGMAATILDSLCNQLVPVWFSDGSKKMLMHPEAEVARLILSGEAAPAHLQDEVAAWREHYGVFAANG